MCLRLVRRRQPAQHVVGGRVVVRATALTKPGYHGPAVRGVHVAAVLELGHDALDGDLDPEDAEQSGRVRVGGIRHVDAGLEHA